MTGVKEELCKSFSEYGRLKQQALRRMVLQELSTPLPEAALANEEPKKKRRKEQKEQAKPEKEEKKEAKPEKKENEAKSEMNGSLRRLYSQSSEEAKAKRREEKFQSERPEERLEDLGGVEEILEDLRQLVVQPLEHPEVFCHLGVQPPTGVLLFGPPGCGKTKIAHAVAGSTGVPFFKIAATEIAPRCKSHVNHFKDGRKRIKKD